MLLGPKENSDVGEEQLDHTSLYSAKTEPESYDDDDDDDYGFTNLKQAQQKLGENDIELAANSTTQSLNIPKQRIAEKRTMVAGEAKLPMAGVSQQEAWSPQQVEVFLNEFKELHRRKHEEVAALESRLQTQQEIEVDLKEQNEQLKRTEAGHKNQNSKFLGSIKEIENRLQHQNTSVQNFSTENEKLTRTNKDLLFKLEKLEQYAEIKQGDMKTEHQALKDAQKEIVDAMEGRLRRFTNLVRGLQAHSRALEEERDEAVQVMQDGLDRQESVAKKYKKKYLKLKEECGRAAGRGRK
jgi:chromosome segregation ATPase